jgi:hypothetical protein
VDYRGSPPTGALETPPPPPVPSLTFVSLLTEVEFNVSEAFVPLATPNSNHSSHTGNDSDSGTLERKRPASMAVMEGDLVKKERYVQSWSLPQK